MKKKKEEKKSNPEELKRLMEECEVRYRESFKGDSCAAIMNAYRDWQYAKKQYYTSIGRAMPATEKDTSDD